MQNVQCHPEHDGDRTPFPTLGTFRVLNSLPMCASLSLIPVGCIRTTPPPSLYRRNSKTGAFVLLINTTSYFKYKTFFILYKGA